MTLDRGESVFHTQHATLALCLLVLGPLAACASSLSSTCQDTEQLLEVLHERCRRDDAELQRCMDAIADGPARRLAESAAGLGAVAEADKVLTEIRRLQDRLELEVDTSSHTGVQK